MKHLTCLGIAFLICSCNCIKKLYVPMADSKHQLEQNVPAHVTRLYFDRKGFLYSDGLVDPAQTDIAIRNSDSRLEAYYAKNPAIYKKLCSNLGVSPSGDINHLTTTNDPLQNELIRRQITSIDQLAQNRELVFIIHGFNEHPLKPIKEGASDEMRRTEKLITDHFPARKFTFVEIYWDGLSKTGGSQNAVSKGLNSFKIWNNSQASANYAGLELRRVFSGLNVSKFVVLTHSHGAGVITNALFNVRKFKPSYYQNPDRWEYEIAERYNNNLYETPKQNIRIGMLAPAIPGINVFDEYGQRTINGQDVKVSLTNYHFLVGFNVNDPVTSKFFLPATWFGATTLACRRNELIQTEQELNTGQTLMEDIDFSYDSSTKQKSHDWFRYLGNSHFGVFMDKLFL